MNIKERFSALPFSLAWFLLLFSAGVKMLPIAITILLAWVVMLPASALPIFVNKTTPRERMKLQVSILYAVSAGSVTLLAYLASLPSVSTALFIGMIVIAVLIYALATALRYSAMKSEERLTGEYSEHLSQRLRNLVGSGYDNIPDVFIIHDRVPMNSRIKVNEFRNRGIYITESIPESLDEAEMDSILLNSFYKISRSVSTWMLYLLFTVYVAESEAFVYSYVALNPAYGVFVVPATGLLLLGSIFLIPFLAYKVLSYPNRWADTFTIKSTGNPEALTSALAKLDRMKGERYIPIGRVTGMVQRMMTRDRERRHSRIMKAKY